MDELVDEGQSWQAEVEPYVQRFSHVCTNDKERQDLERLVFSMYMDVNHPKHFLSFVDNFHVSCTTLGDLQKLCRIAEQFTNVWRDKSLTNLMATVIRGQVFERDESGTLKASGTGIIRLELLVTYLCDPRFVDWFNRGTEDAKDEELFMKFIEGSSTFIHLMDWVHDSISVDPRLLHIFVELWKTNGVEACQQLARMYKYYSEDLKHANAITFAAIILSEGHLQVAEKFLRFLAKKPIVAPDELYREVEVFLEKNDEKGALTILDLERSA